MASKKTAAPKKTAPKKVASKKATPKKVASNKATPKKATPGWTSSYTVDCVDIWPTRAAGFAVLSVQTSSTKDSWRSRIEITKDFATTDPKPIFDVHSWVVSMWLSPTEKPYAISTRSELIANGKKGAKITDKSLSRIWGLSDKELYVIGKAGLVMRYDGKAWSDMSIEGVGLVQRIGGTSSKRLFAVAEKGGLFRWDGKSWRGVKLPTKQTLRGLHVEAAVVHVAGDGGFCASVSDEGVVKVLPSAGKPDFQCVATFGGELYAGAGVKGIFKSDGKKLTAVKPKAPSYAMTSSKNQLLAAGLGAVTFFDGKKWSGWLYE